MNRIDSGQSIWSDSKLMIVKKAKSSGLSEVAAFRGRKGGVGKENGKKKKKKVSLFFSVFRHPPLQTFGKIKQFTERNYYNMWCQFSNKPYRKAKNIDKHLDRLKRKGYLT
jgi:hypothetical protein